MDDLSDIPFVLTGPQKDRISKQLDAENNSVSQIIGAALKGTAIPNHSVLRLNTSTYSKNLSLARQQLFELAAQSLPSEFSGTELVQKLLEAGKTETAFRCIRQLEKQYETEQRWLLLERLYVEAFRYAQVTGNEKLLLAYEKKRNANMIRYAEYSRLSGVLMQEIIRHEGFALRPPDEKQYLKKLQGLQLQTKKLKHYKLIHNSYFIEYMFLSRFTDNASRVGACVRSIRENCRHYRAAMDQITSETAELNFINYLCIYTTAEHPDKTAEKLFSGTQQSGNYLKANLCLTMLEYAAFEEQNKAFEKWYSRLQQLNDDTKFSPYIHALLAVKAFGQKEYAVFKKEADVFLSDTSRALFPDMQFFLRLLELYRQFQTEEYDITLLLASIKTLKVFAGRNLNKNRFSEDLAFLHYLEKTVLALSKNKKPASLPLTHFKFRNTCFLARHL